ncbi:hypothetical protein LY76DRAFT_610632 [Colletotrichum caudatum]|nr:hypothetical protein LY76DRAFT_610632 [Colletotrichum caudatum]
MMITTTFATGGYATNGVPRDPADYSAAHQWKADRVAVIGSGASSVQVVPAMQPYVKQMHVFVRTGVWFVNIPADVIQEPNVAVHSTPAVKVTPTSVIGADGAADEFNVHCQDSGVGSARATVDPSPYLAIDKIDPRWLKASAVDVEKVLEHGAEASVRRRRQESQDSDQDVRVKIESGRV